MLSPFLSAFFLALMSLSFFTQALNNPLASFHYNFKGEDSCPVCLEKFTDLDADDIHIALPECNHPLCAKCFNQLYTNSFTPIKCPMCRGESFPRNTDKFRYTTLVSDAGILLWRLRVGSESELINILNEIVEHKERGFLADKDLAEITAPLLNNNSAKYHDLFYDKLMATAQKTRAFKHGRFDYMSRNFFNKVSKKDSEIVFIASGLSNSSYQNEIEKNHASRALPMYLSKMFRLEKVGKKARIIFLSADTPGRDFLEYLYGIAHRQSSVYGQGWVRNSYKSFEDNYFIFNHILQNEFDYALSANELTGFSATLFDRLKTPLGEHHFVGMATQSHMEIMEKWATSNSIPYLNSPQKTQYLRTKANGRKIFEEAGVKHPLGTYEPVFTKAHLVKKIYELLLSIPGKKIVIKIDRSSGGKGVRILDFNRLPLNKPKKKVLKLIHQKLSNDLAESYNFLEKHDKGVIVEQFIENPEPLSMASICYINNDDDIGVEYVYQQLFKTSDNLSYQGAFGPYPHEEIEKMSREIAHALSRKGVRGYIGIDFVIGGDRERTAYAIEINQRMPETGYAYFTLRNFLGATKMNNRYMISKKEKFLINIPDFSIQRNIQVDLFENFLPSHKCTLDINKGRGCIILADEFEAEGKLKIACVEKSEERVNKLYRKFRKIIEQYYLLKESSYLNGWPLNFLKRRWAG